MPTMAAVNPAILPPIPRRRGAPTIRRTIHKEALTGGWFWGRNALLPDERNCGFAVPVHTFCLIRIRRKYTDVCCGQLR